jgi:hypothetical protein
MRGETPAPGKPPAPGTHPRQASRPPAHTCRSWPCMRALAARPRVARRSFTRSPVAWGRGREDKREGSERCQAGGH